MMRFASQLVVLCMSLGCWLQGASGQLRGAPEVVAVASTTRTGPPIDVENTVVLGADNSEDCSTGKGVDQLTVDKGDSVTYCLRITNAGDVPLSEVSVVNEELGFMEQIGMLQPGESVLFIYTEVVEEDKWNTLAAVSKIEQREQISDSDDSVVFLANSGVTDDEEDEKPDIPTTSPEESFAIDHKMIAETFGWSVEQAESHMAVQRAFRKLVASLETNPNFADSGMAKNPGDSVSVYFKGGFPSEVEDDVNLFARENKVKVDAFSTRFSLREQKERANNIVEVLRQKGFTNITYALGPGDNMEIVVAPPEDAHLPDSPQLDPNARFDLHVSDETARRVLGDDCDESQLYRVRLVIGRGEQFADEHTYGGRGMWSSSTGTTCTTGFSVVHENGIQGVVTAGHCTFMDQYDAVPPENDYSTFFQAQHLGQWGDVEWHTTPHLELPYFYANLNPDDFRPVTSVQQVFSWNEIVCVFSRTQQQEFCDRIHAQNVCVNNVCCLVAMEDHHTQGGDSGGPWSYGTEAAGIHKGWKMISSVKRSVWSRASCLPDALGVNVLVL